MLPSSIIKVNIPAIAGTIQGTNYQMNLRLQIFMIAFALGILPLLTLVGVNLSGHIKRHEEVGQQQAEVQQKLEFANLNSEITHYRQTLALAGKRL